MKGKVAPVHAIMAYMGSSGINLVLRNLTARWRWVATIPPPSLYLRERTPVPVEQELRLLPEPVWTIWRRGKSLNFTYIQNSDPPAHKIISSLRFFGSFRAAVRGLSLAQSVQTGWGTNLASYSTSGRDFFSEVRRTRREARHSSVYRVDGNNKLYYASMLSYAFMTCKGTIHSTEADYKDCYNYSWSAAPGLKEALPKDVGRAPLTRRRHVM
jgi:hypothetical protein